MTTKTLIAAAALAVAAATYPAHAASVTSDPDATMHEQQKLGPNETTRQFSNGFVTQKRGPAYGWNIAPRGYHPGYVQSYGYAPSNDLIDDSDW